MKRILIFGILSMALLSVLLFVLSPNLLFGVTMASEENLVALECQNTMISQPDQNLNSNSIYSTEDGQIFYLVETEDPLQSDLIHVAADNTISNLGTIPIALGVYSFPQWKVDLSRNTIFYNTMQMNDDVVSFGVESINFLTGERNTLATNIMDYSYGYLDEYIWWVDRDNQFGFYNIETEAFSSIEITIDKFESHTVHPVRFLSDNELLLTIAYYDEADYRSKPSWYRANLQTGEVLALHEDQLAINQNSYAESTIVLENSLLYINNDGVFKEIDFSGNVLRSVNLQGHGFYNDMLLTSAGLAYTYHKYGDNYQISENGVYFISNSNIVTELTPHGLNMASWPLDMVLLTTESGQEQLWFSTDPSPERINRTLQGFSIVGETPSPIFTLENVASLVPSPAGNYLIVGQDTGGIIISIEDLERFPITGNYYRNWIFSEAEDKVFYSHENTVYTQNLVTGETTALFTSGYEEPHAFLVDDENQLVYIYETIPSENSMGTRRIYVASLDGESVILANQADVSIPRDTHSSGFRATESEDFVYFSEDWSTLYRATCQRG